MLSSAATSMEKGEAFWAKPSTPNPKRFVFRLRSFKGSGPGVEDLGGLGFYGLGVERI